MLKIIKYKIILFTITVTSLTICTLIICLGFLNLYVDVRPQIATNFTVIQGTHQLIILSIFSFSNISIALHICYMSIHALRGLRSTWFMGCHYLLYVVSELISACVILTEFHKLKHPKALSSLVGALAVCLFVITFAAEKIFKEVDAIIESEMQRKAQELYRKSLMMAQRRQCVRVGLRDAGVNAGATTSRSFFMGYRNV